MNSNLQGAFDKLEKSRRDLFEQLKTYPDEVLNKKPSAEAWSVIDVMHHLMTAEAFSLKYLQKKTQDLNGAGNAGLKAAYKAALLKVVFMLPLKFKVPPVIEAGHKEATLKDTEREWAAIRHGLAEVSGKLNDAELKKALWKHAIAGKMNIYQMVAFLQMHFDRHRAQINRTLQAVKAG